VSGANLEAEDADGDTSLRLVLLQMNNSRETTTTMTFLLNVLFRVQPKNIDKAPAILKARPSTVLHCSVIDKVERMFSESENTLE